MIQLMFQRANVYYDPGSKPESCDGGSFSTFTNLEYELYSYQLQENDFTDRFLYDGIWKMANAKNIKRYGHFVGVLLSSLAFILVNIFPFCRDIGSTLLFEALLLPFHHKSFNCFIVSFWYCSTMFVNFYVCAF